MELSSYTKLIDDFINENNAMSLLFDTYQAITDNAEKEKFVLALIGSAVASHQLLKFKMK